MGVFRLPSLQRLVLLVLLLGLVGSLGERGIADVHDGGATHGEVDRATGISHDSHHTGVVDHPSSETGTPESSDHAAHVCHCSHSHTGVVSVPAALASVLSSTHREPLLSDQRPASVSVAPSLRPPIA
jgi:hypothetical protein